MAPVVGNVIRCAVRHSDAFGSDIVNNFDLEILAAGTGGDTGFAQDVEEKMDTAYSIIAGVFPSSLTPRDITFLHRTSSVYIPPITYSPTSPPSSGADPLPPGTCLLVLWHTAVRRTQSRTYLGPSCENSNTAGVPASTTVTDVLSWAAEIDSESPYSNGWQFRHVLWSVANVSALLLSTPVVMPQWASLRRRRPGRGS